MVDPKCYVADPESIQAYQEFLSRLTDCRLELCISDKALGLLALCDRALTQVKSLRNPGPRKSHHCDLEFCPSLQ